LVSKVETQDSSTIDIFLENKFLSQKATLKN